MAQIKETLQSAADDDRTVMLVDDDPDHRELYSRRLARLGYSVTAIGDVDEAVRAVAERAPEAVILDIAMPGRDGVSVLQELIALRPTLPVIIHTAYPGFRDNFLTWAAEAFVQKSTDLRPLAAALSAVTSSSRGRCSRLRA